MTNNNKFARNQAGNFALYAIIFLLFGVILSILLFFPEFLNMQSGIYGISCKEMRTKLQSATYDYDINNSVSIVSPGKVVDADLLKERGYLAEIQTCPNHGKFRFDKNGKVICTFHSKNYKLK